MTSIKCPKCGTDMDPKKPCPDCGHEIGAPKKSEDSIKPPKIVEEDLSGNCKDSKDACTKKMDGKCPDGCKGKKAKSGSVDRIDYWGDLNASATMTEPLESTGNGALIGKAAIFGTGVYRYMGADGKVTAEFRPPEEVFSKDTLASYRMVPLTNNHPAEKVTPDNAKKYAVGNLGEHLSTDAYNAYARIIIHDSEAIAAVEAGRTGLSGGYSCDVVTEGEVSYPVMGWKKDTDGEWKEMEVARTVYKIPGNFNGTPYDAIQTNIRGNHVALVDIPRGGDALHLRFDGADVGVGVRISDTQPTPTNQKESQMAKIKLDGAHEHEVPEAVKVHLDSLDAKVASLEAEKKDSAAALSAANAALAAVQKERDDALSAMPSKVQEAVSARLALVEKVDGYGVEVKHEDSEDDIKRSVVASAMPSVNLDGMDAVNLSAHFAAACTILDSKKTDGTPAQLQQMQKPKADSQDKVDGSDWGAYQESIRK
jgi:uncharacterized protein